MFEAKLNLLQQNFQLLIVKEGKKKYTDKQYKKILKNKIKDDIQKQIMNNKRITIINF